MRKAWIGLFSPFYMSALFFLCLLFSINIDDSGMLIGSVVFSLFSLFSYMYIVSQIESWKEWGKTSAIFLCILIGWFAVTKILLSSLSTGGGEDFLGVFIIVGFIMFVLVAAIAGVLTMVLRKHLQEPFKKLPRMLTAVLLVSFLSFLSSFIQAFLATKNFSALRVAAPIFFMGLIPVMVYALIGLLISAFVPKISEEVNKKILLISASLIVLFVVLPLFPMAGPLEILGYAFLMAAPLLIIVFMYSVANIPLGAEQKVISKKKKPEL